MTTGQVLTLTKGLFSLFGSALRTRDDGKSYHHQRGILRPDVGQELWASIKIAVAVASHGYFLLGGDNPTMAGTITALKLQKKNKERVNVYLDDRYAFSLTAIEAAKLRRGQLLSDQEIEGLLERDSVEKAYARALRFLSYRPRSEAEVRRQLQGKKTPPTIETEVVERLTSIGLLDDRAFAKYWVENRENFKPRGRHALRYELRQKGLSEEIIALALEDIDEEESAYRALTSRVRLMSPLDRGSFRKKWASFLRRRGFSYETINAAIERTWREMVEEGRMPDESEG